MGCDFPEHHGSSGGGFSLLPVLVVLGVVALLASVITVIIHVVAMVLTFLGAGALVAGVIGVPLWWRRHRGLRVAYQPQMMNQRRGGLPLDGGQQAIGQGDGLHLHLHGVSPEDAAEYMRRMQGR